MADTQAYGKQASFMRKWLEGGNQSTGTLLTEQTSMSTISTGSRVSASQGSWSLWEDEDIAPPPPPEPLRETSSYFDGWDMKSTDSLSPDEIQAIMIAIGSAEKQPVASFDEFDDVFPVNRPAVCTRNVSIQQLPSVGGPEFLVTIANNDHDENSHTLTEEDIAWLTGDITKPTMATRRFTIQTTKSPSHSPERQRLDRPHPITRKASVQTLPIRNKTDGSSYWVTLPSSNAAVWKVKSDPDPVARQVSVQIRRPSKRPSQLRFFHPSSRMNGKGLTTLVDPSCC